MACPLTRERFDAVLFDLDGVLTATARVHAVCWKRMFDEFLQQWAESRGEPFQPFDIDADYREYVDGKRRYDGVRSFLQSRGMELPEGEPGDAASRETVCGLGNRKNELINEVIETEGVEVFEGSVKLIRHLLAQGIRAAVVSSSANCLTVMRAAGIEDLFEVRIDGVIASERGLPGKPAPDTFLAAASDLGVDPKRAAVVEDAISGVQAGRAGGFALVIGVDRVGEAETLRRNGADLVVSDLGELLP
jgi:beta-phosphoglucomutase family hydrolase